MRTAALFATVAVLVALLVSHCAGRPWQQRRQQQQQRQRQQRQRPSRPVAAPVAAVYEPSTASAVIYAEYDDPSVAVIDPSTSSLHQVPSEEPDYGDPDRLFVEPERVYAEPEQNYEVDEAVSVLSDGRVHGVQQHQVPTTTTPSSFTSSTTTTTTIILSSSSTTNITTSSTTTTSSTMASSSTDATTIVVVGSSGSTISDTTAAATPAAGANAETRKSGYVLNGKHYRKYRVEEETPDGFIVGEYGVVSHHDGTTRGVRYTADSSINPRVIYEALAKFLALRRRR